jgi:hypothetical protein
MSGTSRAANAQSTDTKKESMMTTTPRGASGHHQAPDSAFDGEEREGTTTEVRIALGGRQPDSNISAIGGGAGGSRRKRRRQRSPGGKRWRPQGHVHSEGLNREHIFQELEGLLRQIREEAEESSNRTVEEVGAMARTVTTFTKELEEQSDPVSERLRSEYQRIRGMLTQALRGER